jgi:hypothetical protein
MKFRHFGRNGRQIEFSPLMDGGRAGFGRNRVPTKIRPGYFRIKPMNHTLKNQASNQPAQSPRATWGGRSLETQFVRHRRMKPGFYLLRLRLEYTRTGFKPCIRVLSPNRNISSSSP